MNPTLEEKMAKMMNTTRGANLTDLQELSKVFLDVIKELKDAVEATINENRSESYLKIDEVVQSLSQAEINLQNLITDAKTASANDISALNQRLTSELYRLESLIPIMPVMPDLGALEARLNAKVDEMPAQIVSNFEKNLPQYGTSFRDGLEVLQGDERLDARAIKGLDRQEEILKTDIMNRAIGIVDQRTSFLINRVSALTTRMDGIDTNIGVGIGNSIANGTPGSVLFIGAGGVLAQDNADFFWDATNMRLGLGTNTPTASFETSATSSATSIAGNLLVSLMNTNNVNGGNGSAIGFKMVNASSAVATYAAISGGRISGAETTGNENGQLRFGTINAGTMTSWMSIANTGAVVVGTVAAATTGVRLQVAFAAPYFLLDNTSATNSHYAISAATAGNILQFYGGNLTWDSQPYANRGTAASGTTRLHLSSTGQLGINLGSTAPAAGLDVLSTSGIVRFADVATDTTNKNFRFGSRHYTAAEEDMGLIFGQSTSAANSISIGGGTSTFNAATVIGFYGAANNTTTTGTLVGTVTLNSLSIFNRVNQAQGADVASAGDLTLGVDGNTFEITGTTTINAITVANWTLGSMVTLMFSSSVTVKHNTAGGGGTSVMLLSGAADFAATGGDTLTLRYCEIGGVNAWRECGRAVI